MINAAIDEIRAMESESGGDPAKWTQHHAEVTPTKGAKLR
jgi:hypothetical protein